MDTTKQNILMCEKAEEIQKEWSPQVGDWVLVDRSSLFKDEKRYFTTVIGINFQSHYTYAEGGRDIDLNRAIWLPTQGQLQNMVKHLEEDIRFARGYDSLLYYLEKFKQNVLDRYCRTMEQLWLAFVMWELYKKKWNGETWILN